MRWARFFPILSEAALILIYAPRAAYGSTDMRRLCPGRIFLYLPLIFITFASQHGGRRLVVLASIAQRFCAFLLRLAWRPAHCSGAGRASSLRLVTRGAEEAAACRPGTALLGPAFRPPGRLALHALDGC